MSQTCVCDDSNDIVVQCDEDKRYFYARVSVCTNCSGPRLGFYTSGIVVTGIVVCLIFSGFNKVSGKISSNSDSD